VAPPGARLSRQILPSFFRLPVLSSNSGMQNATARPRSWLRRFLRLLYGEVNSLGPDVAGILHATLQEFSNANRP
jgi:hypothetical protein